MHPCEEKKDGYQDFLTLPCTVDFPGAVWEGEHCHFRNASSLDKYPTKGKQIRLYVKHADLFLKDSQLFSVGWRKWGHFLCIQIFSGPTLSVQLRQFCTNSSGMHNTTHLSPSLPERHLSYHVS